MKIKLSVAILLASVILAACAPTDTVISPEAVILPSNTISAPTNTEVPTSTITPILPTAMPPLSGPYLGQEPPGLEPEPFAPGIVSIPGFTEFSGAFSPDGSEYYFYRWSEESITTLLFSKVINGQWTAPEQLALSAGYDAFLPFVTVDNKWLYFAWRHPVPAGQPGFPSYFVAERTENGWSEPKYAGQGMFLSSTRDGQLFTTDMSERDRTRQTYLARLDVENGLFVNLERLPIQVRLGSQAHP